MGLLGNTFGPGHLLIIVALIVLLFGAPKLPALARSLGQSMRIFKSEVKTMKDDGKDSGSKTDGGADDGLPPETLPKP